MEINLVMSTTSIMGLGLRGGASYRGSVACELFRFNVYSRLKGIFCLIWMIHFFFFLFLFYHLKEIASDEMMSYKLDPKNNKTYTFSYFTISMHSHSFDPLH